MIRVFKAIIIAMVLFLTTAMPVHGFDEATWQEKKSAGETNPTNPVSWRQATGDACQPIELANKPIPGLAYTYGSGGCTYFSTLYLLIRVGVWNPETDGTMIDFTNYMVEKGVSGYAPSGPELTKLFPEMEAIPNNYTGNYTGLKKTIKEIFDRGNFALLYCNSDMGGHAIYVDKLDENGDICLLDSSWSDATNMLGETNWWSLARSDSPGLCYGVFEYHVEGVTPQNTKTMYERYANGNNEGFDLNGKSNKNDKDSKGSKGSKWHDSESDMLGFKSFSELAKQLPMVDMAKVESEREKARLADIKTSIEETDKQNQSKMISIVQGIFGFLLCIYGIFLYIGYHVDRNNPLERLSLIELMTLGKCELDREGYGNRRIKEKIILTNGKIVISVFLLMGLGILILSGGLSNIIVWVIHNIT